MPDAAPATTRIAECGRQLVVLLASTFSEAAIRSVAVNVATSRLGRERHPILTLSDADSTAWIETIANRTFGLLGSVLRDARADTIATPPDDRWVVVSDRARLLWLDAALAARLERVGPKSALAAAEIRTMAKRAWKEVRGVPATESPVPAIAEAFRRWNHELRAVELAVRCLVADTLEPVLRDRGVPSLPVGYAPATVRSTLAPGDDLQWRPSTSGGADAIDRGGRIVACSPVSMTGGELAAAAARPAFLAAAGSMVAHRLLRYIAWKARELALLHELDLNVSVPRITVPGGMTRLAELIGAGRKKTAEVELALDLFQSLHAIANDGTSFAGLLTWQRSLTNAPGRASELVIVPSDSLLHSGAQRGKLVPVPRTFPPLAGSPNQWAAQAGLQLLVLDEMRVHAAELVTHGGVQVSRRRWQQLATEARVSRRLLEELLNVAWVSDGPRGPAFLRPLGHDRWTLAKTHEAELATLRDGGAYDRYQSERGKRGAAARMVKVRATL